MALQNGEIKDGLPMTEDIESRMAALAAQMDALKADHDKERHPGKRGGQTRPAAAIWALSGGFERGGMVKNGGVLQFMLLEPPPQKFARAKIWEGRGVCGAKALRFHPPPVNDLRECLGGD